MEMTFTVYRTTKGRRLGEPILAEIEVENPRTGYKYRTNLSIHEYYTNKRLLPGGVPGWVARRLKVTIRCKSATQYLGMAESDFYLLASEGDFGLNFFKGLLGIWLQAMVLATIGVFAGTFLSWPVALLFTVAFFVAGHAAVSVLGQFFRQTMVGGGPFEALIRLLTHDNQMSELAATPGAVVAKSLDAVVTPVMSADGLPHPQPLLARRQQHRGRRVRRHRPPGPANTLIAAGLRRSLLHLCLLHPQESRGGGVSFRLTNMQRKIVFAVGILLLFTGMYPYKIYLRSEAQKKDLGEATIGSVDTGSFVLKLFLLGGFRGHGRQHPLDAGHRLSEGPGVGQAEGDGRHDHQAPAALPGDLDLSELEPDLQRLGRVGRPRRQVRLDQAGDQVRPGRRQTRTAARPT